MCAGPDVQSLRVQLWTLEHTLRKMATCLTQALLLFHTLVCYTTKRTANGDGLFLPFARTGFSGVRWARKSARARRVCVPLRVTRDPSGRSLGSPIVSRAPQGPIVNTENGNDASRRPCALWRSQ